MKRTIWNILAALLLLGGLAACAQPVQAGSPSGTRSEPSETEHPEPPALSEADAGVCAPEAVMTRTSAYRAALEGLYYDRVFPDWDEVYFDDYFDMTDNRFAVYDVDLDGREELILEYTTTIAAGMITGIFDFDSETHTLRKQMMLFPRLTFFDNGAIEEGLSHNQGHGGRFWPYTLYQYNPETDSYDKVGSADAWDTVQFPEGFPEGVEPDADGFLYFLDMDYDMPVDGETYAQWRSLHVGGAQIIDVPYVYLTEENIAALDPV